MNLAQLTKDMPELISITSGENTEIGFLTADSRAKVENGLFFCLPGARFDGHAFAPQALSNGCCALYGQNQEEVRFLLASVMLAFGGICVTMQTMSATKGLSLRYYFMGKGLQTIFSFLLSCGFILRQWYLLLFVPVFFLMVQEKEEKKCSNPRKAVV